MNTTATWQSGDAEACKALYSGSIPLVASRPCAWYFSKRASSCGWFTGRAGTYTKQFARHAINSGGISVCRNTLTHARVAELVDARDLKSLARWGRAGSTPAPGTINNINSRKKNELHITYQKW